MNYTVVYKRDLSRPDIMELLHTIKEKNSDLHAQISTVFDKKENELCREDVLSYLAEQAPSMYKDTLYVYHIAALIENMALSPAWYQWINDYFIKGGGTGVDDFMIALSEATEKHMPLEDAMRMFEQGGDDILSIYEAIDQYQPEQHNTEEEHTSEEETDIMSDNQEAGFVETCVPEHDVSSNLNTSMMENGMDNFTGMFESLVKAMSIKGRSMDNEVLDVQDNLNRIVAKFQLAITELSAYSTEIIREWEKDKEENQRMMALNNLQKKVLESQQRKMNELRNENSKLNLRIQEVNKAELRRAAISMKLSELQTLASDQEDSISEIDWSDELF